MARKCGLLFQHGSGLKVSNVKDPVPIYFVLTSHGWYWTSISPLDKEKEPNWVSATKETLGPGSEHAGKTVVEGADGISFAKLQNLGLAQTCSASQTEH